MVFFCRFATRMKGILFMNESFVNSHIQMPESILKKFTNAGGGLFHYDVQAGEIKRGHAKTLNSEYAFYSREMEDKLSKEIETPFGRIIKYLESNEFAEYVDSPRQIEEVSNKYIYALLARTVARNKKATALDEIHIMHVPPYMQHDALLVSAFELAEVNELFKDYFVTFLVNKTNIPLVLPMSGAYDFDDIIVAPVTPWRGVVWVKKKKNLVEPLINGDKCKVFLADKQEDVMKLNIRAFDYECQNNRRNIVSPDRKVLEDLQKIYYADQENAHNKR